METGERTEAADALQYIWQGVWPRNRAPSVSLIRLAGETANQSVVGVAGMRLQADVVALDAENDALTYRWTVRPESQAKEIDISRIFFRHIKIIIYFVLVNNLLI